MLAKNNLETAEMSQYVGGLQSKLSHMISKGQAGELAKARSLNDVTSDYSARFLALEHESAQAWQASLHAHNIITDVRGNVLRIGLGLYHDEDDIERLCRIAVTL